MMKLKLLCWICMLLSLTSCKSGYLFQVKGGPLTSQVFLEEEQVTITIYNNSGRTIFIPMHMSNRSFIEIDKAFDYTKNEVRDTIEGLFISISDFMSTSVELPIGMMALENGQTLRKKISKDHPIHIPSTDFVTLNWTYATAIDECKLNKIMLIEGNKFYQTTNHCVYDCDYNQHLRSNYSRFERSGDRFNLMFTKDELFQLNY